MSSIIMHNVFVIHLLSTGRIRSVPIEFSIMEDKIPENTVSPVSTDSSLQGSGSGSHSDEIEQKIWNIVQGVPGLNVGYGSIRLVVYIGKGNKDEALRSALGVIKGLVQSAAIVGSVFIAPVVTPLAAGALTGIVTESIQGAAHVVIFIVEHSGELRKKLPDSKEKAIYEEIKEMPTVGAVYSTIRAPIYAVKGDVQQVKNSGVSVASGSAIAAINFGVNVIPGLDAEGKSFIQKISQSVIQLLSRKVMEDVSQEKISLEDGLNLVKSVEERCDTLEIITLENAEEVSGITEQSDKDELLKNQTEIMSDNQSFSESVDRNEVYVNDQDIENKIKTIPDKKSNNAIKATLKRIAKILKRENKCGGNTIEISTVEGSIAKDVLPDHALHLDQDNRENTGNLTE